MQFELEKQNATLENFAPRQETRGSDKSPAADLKLSVNMPNDVLAQFAPSLRSALYWKAGVNDLANVTHEAPNLRHPKMSGFKWSDEVVGACVTISHGIGGPSDLTFEGCKVGSFRVEPQEGGTVLIDFRVQCKPDEHQAGKLYLLQGTAVELTVTPPAVEDDATDLAGDKPLNQAGTESEGGRRGGRRGPAAHSTVLSGH